MTFELNRLRAGDRIAGVGAVILLVAMFFFAWFDIKVPGFFGAYVSAAGVSTSRDAWNSLEVIRWLLLFTVIAAAALGVLAGWDRKSGLPFALSTMVTALGASSAILVFYRAIVSHPFVHAEVKLGSWLGLAACVMIAYGGFRAMMDEGTMPAGARAVESSP
jgi:hypothetical protein